MPPDQLTAELLAKGPFGRPDAPYRLVEARGPDAGDFLQRLCTQDVLGLTDGQVAPAAFLDAKGKLLVTCLVARWQDSFWLEVQQEQEERLAVLLDRYHFTEKLAIGRGRLTPCQEWVEGADPGRGDALRAAMAPGGILLQHARRGVVWSRAHGVVDREAHEIARRLPNAPQPLTPDLAECLRMLVGLVRVGVETEPTTLALEADLDDHCSQTKGCYTGQEIVARIHTYGHVNRRLCLLQLAAGPAIDAPVPLQDDDGLPVGRVMHAVPVPDRALRLGLGYLPKDFQAPGTVLSLADGARATVLR